MPAWLKLATGIAATGLATDAYYMFERQQILADLAAQTIPILTAHHVTDASISWTTESGWTTRTARITGTATDPAAITAEIAALPGIHAATWTQR
jgi:hypothetical protein